MLYNSESKIFVIKMKKSIIYHSFDIQIATIPMNV